MDIASDVTSEPRFLAAEASIFTSETPSITLPCFSSIECKDSISLLHMAHDIITISIF